MKLLNKIKSWSTEKKRIFSISLAVFFTILIIIFNSAINLLWKDGRKNTIVNNNPIEKIQKSFSEIIDEVTPTLEQIFSTTTQEMTTPSDEIIDQNNSTSSSFSTTSNVVE